MNYRKEVRYYLIFLDIDGVLDSEMSYEERHERFLGKRRAKEMDYDEWALKAFDRNNVMNLNGIIEELPNTKIVISSTWRLGRTVSDLQELLSKVGFKYPETIVGKTRFICIDNEDGTSEHVRRGIEIQNWLIHEMDFYLENFIIIDDDADMEHLMPHLVKTNYKHGLNTKKTMEAIKKLKGVD